MKITQSKMKTKYRKKQNKKQTNNQSKMNQSKEIYNPIQQNKKTSNTFDEYAERKNFKLCEGLINVPISSHGTTTAKSVKVDKQKINGAESNVNNLDGHDLQTHTYKTRDDDNTLELIA